MKLIVQIPCYNEVDTFAELLLAIDDVGCIETMIVDDTIAATCVLGGAA